MGWPTPKQKVRMSRARLIPRQWWHRGCEGGRGLSATDIRCDIGCKARKRKSHPEVAFLSKCLMHIEKFWWRFTDSNRGPVDYDSIALTD